MVCGGAAEVLIEPVAVPGALDLGGGHCGMALSSMAAMVGFGDGLRLQAGMGQPRAASGRGRGSLCAVRRGGAADAFSPSSSSS